MSEDKQMRHLLLDNRVVSKVVDARLVLGTVKKHLDNPLFPEDKPWEKRFDNLYANVLYDDEEQLYKCWYSPFIIDYSTLGMSMEQRRTIDYRAPRNREMAICYATSKDGLTWDKPDLGFVKYRGSTANNIVWRGEGGSRVLRAGPHGGGVFKDLNDPDPKRRYKALLKSKILSVAFSEDGLHWDAPIECPAANSAGDTHNNAFWAPTLGKYVGITRQWSKQWNRQVARTTSDDFLNWTPTEVVLEGEKNFQTYSMPVFYHAGVYLGLLVIHDQTADRVWTELTWSPDTETWHRINEGTPFVANDGVEGCYDWGCVYVAANPVFLDNEIRLYYGGSDGLHTSWRNSYFCLATLRPDGFAGYRAEKAGSVETITLSSGITELCVTADIEPDGEVMVHAIGSNGEVIASSQSLTRTGTDIRISWKGEGSEKMTGDTTSPAGLRFSISKATVYSFSIA